MTEDCKHGMPPGTCATCNHPEIVYCTAGGQTYHKTRKCSALRAGQDAVDAKGGNRSQIWSESKGSALAYNRRPCARCYPRLYRNDPGPREISLKDPPTRSRLDTNHLGRSEVELNELCRLFRIYSIGQEGITDRQLLNQMNGLRRVNKKPFGIADLRWARSTCD